MSNRVRRDGVDGVTPQPAPLAAPRVDVGALLQRANLTAEQWREVALLLDGQCKTLQTLLLDEQKLSGDLVASHAETIKTLSGLLDTERCFTRLAVEVAKDARAPAPRPQPKKSHAAQLALLQSFEQMKAQLVAERPRERPTDRAVVSYFFQQLAAMTGKRSPRGTAHDARVKTWCNLLSAARSSARANPEKGRAPG